MADGDRLSDAARRKAKEIALGIRSVRPDGPLLGGEGVLGADRRGEPAHSLAKWLAHHFNYNATEYDKAIDHVYNTTHIGGSQYHHLLDGQHSIWGAFHAVQHVNVDTGWLTHLGHALEHLARDTMSVAGINPFFSLSPEHFEAAARHLHISKPFLADALTVNGPELLGGGVALVSALLMARKSAPERLSRFSGGCLLSAARAANPLLLPIAAAGMVYAITQAEDRKVVLIQSGKGAFVSGTALLTSSLVGGPAWLACVAGFMAGTALSVALDHPEATMKRVVKLIQPAVRVFHDAATLLRDLRPQEG